MRRSRALFSIPADWSAPTTRNPAATTIVKYLPVPQDASSISLPAGQARSSRATH
jgi:hypothetical protein